MSVLTGTERAAAPSRVDVGPHRPRPAANAAAAAPGRAAPATESAVGAHGNVAAATRLRPRWSLRQLALLAAALVVIGFVAYRYRDGIDLAVWRAGPNWAWVGLAVVAALAMQVGNVWNLTGASPVPLAFGRTLAVQFAGTLARLVAPSAVGGAAINVQYLRRSGAGNMAALGAVTVAQAVQVMSAFVLFPVVAGVTSFQLGLGSAPPLVWVGIGVALVGAVVTGVLVARRYPLVEAKLKFWARELTRSLRAMMAAPAKAALSLAGAAAISAGMIGALWASVHAFGGDLGIGLAACVLVVGTAAGNAVPVPGGIGTVEAALVAALGAIGGIPVAVAVPAVALFRLVTLWLQLPAGVVCAAGLRRVGAL